MCGGEQGERRIGIRAWKMQRNTFHYYDFFCPVALLKMCTIPLGENCVLQKKAIPHLSIYSQDSASIVCVCVVSTQELHY